MLILLTGAKGGHKFAVDHKAIKIVDKAADPKQQGLAVVGITAIVVSLPPQVLTYEVKETSEEVLKIVNDAHERELQLLAGKSPLLT